MSLELLDKPRERPTERSVKRSVRLRELREKLQEPLRTLLLTLNSLWRRMVVLNPRLRLPKRSSMRRKQLMPPSMPSIKQSAQPSKLLEKPRGK